MSPSVALIIVNWNGYNYTKNCLISLQKLAYVDYGIILVDNGSEDNSADKLVEEFGHITLIKNDINLGFSGGNNVGIKYALNVGFDYICLLNNDTEVEPDFLDVLVNFALSHAETGAVQPKILYNQKRNVIWNAGGKYFPLFGFTMSVGSNKSDGSHYSQVTKVDWVTGCCMLISCNTVQHIGLLNEQFFAYCEDVDWSFRIRASGKELYMVPEAKIYHEAGSSSKTKEKGKEGYVSPFIHYLNIRNRFFILRSYSSGLAKVISVATHSLRAGIYILYFLIRGRFTKLKSVWHGLRDGILSPVKNPEEI